MYKRQVTYFAKVPLTKAVVSSVRTSSRAANFGSLLLLIMYPPSVFCRQNVFEFIAPGLRLYAALRTAEFGLKPPALPAFGFGAAAPVDKLPAQQCGQRQTAEQRQPQRPAQKQHKAAQPRQPARAETQDVACLLYTSRCV